MSEHDWRSKNGRVVRRPIRTINIFDEFCSGCGAKRTITVSGSPGHPDTFKESSNPIVPDHCPTPHNWEIVSVDCDLQPDGVTKWEIRIERCATCDARRRRKLEKDGLDRVREDQVLLTDPGPLPACK